MVPEWPSGWIYRASSLTGLNRPREACQTLKDAAARFPSDEIILYDLACACCSMSRIEEAKGWLGRAIEAVRDGIKLNALEDSDLERLWRETPSRR
jgi:tetratricopeptide (TPR) repeat protein